jgi:hypothetical protein
MITYTDRVWLVREDEVTYEERAAFFKAQVEFAMVAFWSAATSEDNRVAAGGGLAYESTRSALCVAVTMWAIALGEAEPAFLGACFGDIVSSIGVEQAGSTLAIARDVRDGKTMWP